MSYSHGASICEFGGAGCRGGMIRFDPCAMRTLFIVLLPARNDCAYPLVLLLVLVLFKKKKKHKFFFANQKGKIVCYFIITQF